MAQDKSAEIRRTLIRRCAKLGVPVSGIFELTPRCNLRCKMCYIRLSPAQMAQIGQELTTDQWLQLASDAKDAGMIFLLLTGGEPTMREDFPLIYEQLAKMGFSISINTNGTLLTPELRQLWHQLPPASVNVTLYGVSREDYAALCGDGSAFDRVVSGLKWLKEEGILVHLNTTIVPTNHSNWLKIEEFAQRMGLELRMTTYCFPPVRQAECVCSNEFTRLSPEAAGELIVHDLYYREGADPILRYAADLSVPPQTGCDSEIGEAMQCMAGKSQFWVTWDGRMTPCGMLTEPQSHPMTEGYASAWEKLRQATDDIRLCPECVSCEERHTCRNCAAVTYAETGSFSGKPEYMCHLNHAYREQITKLAAKLQDGNAQ